MSYKKFFVGTALATLMSFLPGHAFSSPVPASTSIEGEGGGFYVSGQYRPSMPFFGDFTAKEDANKDKSITVLGVKKSETAVLSAADNTAKLEAYKPEYKNGYLGFGGAVGYSMGGPRVELEGSYTKFDIEDTGFQFKDNAKVVVLARESASQTRATGNENYSTVENKGVSTYAAAMVNACYDVASDDMPVAPYLCAGAGVDVIKFLKDKENKDSFEYKFAYQAKAGVSYAVNPQMAVFIDAFYHGNLSDEYKERKLETQAIANKPATFAAATTATVTNRLGYFGGEAGIRVTF